MRPKIRRSPALAAQSYFSAALLGKIADGRAGADLLARLDDPNGAPATAPEVLKAQGLRALLAQKFPEAKTKLSDAITAADNGRSRAHGTRLGAPQDVRPFPGAQRDFAKAIAINGDNAAALYGLAISKERNANLPEAASGFQKTIAKSPQHFGAKVGLLRLAKKGVPAPRPAADIRKELEAIAVNPKAAPHEQAEALLELATDALEAGRTPDAENGAASRDRARSRFERAQSFASARALRRGQMRRHGAAAAQDRDERAAQFGCALRARARARRDQRGCERVSRRGGQASAR